MPITELFTDSGWIDSHCHLNEVTNLGQQLLGAAKHHINSFIIPGTTPAQWLDILALQSPQVHVAVGIHPWYVTHPIEQIESLAQWLQDHQVVAVGEIGLDYYQGQQPRPEHTVQLEVFEAQLKLAKQHNLPVILHSVKAHNDVLRLLKKLKVNRGVVHAFSGNAQIAQSYIDQGLHLGVGPMILKSPKTLNAVANMPIEKLVLETDAPFMATQALQEANPLLDLLRVGQVLAEHKSLSIEDIQHQTRLNTQRLFGFTN